jgi:cobalt-zinc-cadmium efflux system membrane fusion protein
MNRHSWTIIAVAITLAFLGAVAESSDDAQGHDQEHEHEEHGGEAFTVSDFAKLGVTTATAGPGTVDVALDHPGEIRPNGDRIAHIAARFPGVVRDVRAGIGDRVHGGDTLATIESENLSTYAIRAPFDGTVIDRHMAVGEMVDQASAIFILADLSTVWLEVNVHQHGLAHVAPGRTVTLREVAGDRSARAEIAYVSPIIDQETRTATARAIVANDDGSWRPGTFVVATIEEPVVATVVIPRHALQTFEGATTVFVVDGDRFEPRRVTVGAQGRTRVAVTSGLAAGDRVAEEGSFLVNAELAKGEAGHDH